MRIIIILAHRISVFRTCRARFPADQGSLDAAAESRQLSRILVLWQRARRARFTARPRFARPGFVALVWHLSFQMQTSCSRPTIVEPELPHALPLDVYRSKCTSVALVWYLSIQMLEVAQARQNSHLAHFCLCQRSLLATSHAHFGAHLGIRPALKVLVL